MNICSACANDRRREIDADLRLPKAVASRVARRYGVSEQALRRHIRGGHVEPAQGASQATQGAAQSSDDSPAAVLREAVDALRAMDVTKLAPRAQMDRVDALRRATEALAKIEPAKRVETMTMDDYLDAEGGLMRRFIASLFHHLEPYPAVREAVLADIKKFEQEAAA
jgi:transposase-like protein